VALATLPWRAGRTSRPRGIEVAASQPVVDEPRLDRTSLLATDGFFDAVILASVLMFLVLALGVAMLALQATLLR
jgi:hypothetical protein